MKTKKLLLAAIGLGLAVIMAVGCLLTTQAHAAPASDTLGGELKIAAKSALLMDYDTGTVVFEQNANQHLPIASMVKIMTLLKTFEAVEEGKLAFDEDIVASQNATSMGGSQAFLDTNAGYKLSELIKSIVVGSANDSCVAIAEKISGSVEGFVGEMNVRAKELGMNDTVFVNCTGLPSNDAYSSAKDVGIMTRALLTHPSFYKFSTVWMFDFLHPSGRITQLSNTNKLIRAYQGCDGGKTGFTNEAMFCLSATAKRGDTRLISVVCGAQTSKIRNGENAKLFNYGFGHYQTQTIVLKGNVLADEILVEHGKDKSIRAVCEKDFCAFGKKGDKSAYTTKTRFESLCAPVEEGQKIGELDVFKGDEKIGSVNLISDRSVKKLTYLDIVDDFIGKW